MVSYLKGRRYWENNNVTKKQKVSLFLAQQISKQTHTVNLDRKILPFTHFSVEKQCNHYQKVQFPKGLASAYLEDIDIPYLNKER